MIIIPFIYFLILFVYIYKKRGFDISACMIFIYMISAFASILLYHFKGLGLIDYSKFKITFMPVLLYCSLSSLLVLPFYRIDTNKKRTLLFFSKRRLFDRIVYIYVAIFFIVLLYVSGIIMNNIAIGLADVRNEYYGGNFNPLQNFSFFNKLVYYSASYLSGGSYIMTILYFYSIVFLKNKRLYNTLLFISTTTPIIGGMVISDRSSTIFWFLSFVLSFMLFKPYMSRKTKKSILWITGLFIVLICLYFIKVSMLRFSEGDSGTLGGIIDYVGQPFLNFSDTWERLNTSYHTYARIFPLSNTLFHHSESVGKIIVLIENQTGLRLNGFYSVIGIFLVDLGRAAVIIGPVLLYCIFNYAAKYQTGVFCISNAIVYYMAAIIPFCGAIAYFYSEDNRIVGLIVFLIIAHKFRKSSIMSS